MGNAGWPQPMVKRPKQKGFGGIFAEQKFRQNQGVGRSSCEYKIRQKSWKRPRLTPLSGSVRLYFFCSLTFLKK